MNMGEKQGSVENQEENLIELPDSDDFVPGLDLRRDPETGEYVEVEKKGDE